jgi:hypothetical protein
MAKFSKLIVVAGSVIILTMCLPAYADETKKPEDQPKSGVQMFAGLKFGVGVALTVGIGEKPCIESATIVEGKVRVQEERDAVATVMLESHYLFEMSKIGNREWGLGPFVGIQPGGSDEIIEAFGLGVMIGFKRKPTDTSSWNLGVAYIVDPSVKVLGDGFEENQEPPPGEKEVRLKKRLTQEFYFLCLLASNKCEHASELDRYDLLKSGHTCSSLPFCL